MIADAINMLVPEATKRGITLQADGLKGPLLVRDDRIHLQQVLLNLAIRSGQGLSSPSPAPLWRHTVKVSGRKTNRPAVLYFASHAHCFVRPEISIGRHTVLAPIVELGGAGGGMRRHLACPFQCALVLETATPFASEWRGFGDRRFRRRVLRFSW